MRSRNLIRRACWIVPLLVCSMCLLASPSAASDDDDVPRFGPWSAPVNLGPMVNSAGVEQGPVVSNDGLSLYFAWSPLGTGADIYVSQRVSVNDPWGPPQKLGPNINTPFHDVNPALSPDGHSLYFQSNRPGGSGAGDIYVSRRHNKRDDFGWQPAENLGTGVNSFAGERNPCVFEDDGTGEITLYFDSNRPGGIGGFDIYSSELQPDETFGPAVLVEELSSPWNDQGPGNRRDGLEIYIGSDRPGTLGLEDLYVSTRTNTSEPWSEPVHLGSVVNFVGHDTQPSLSFDGTALYFTSAARPENVGGQGFFDLWVTTRTKLKEVDEDNE